MKGAEESPFKSRFAEKHGAPLDNLRSLSLRRCQSHCGAMSLVQQTSVLSAESQSPSRACELSGKQQQHRQALNAWQKVHRQEDVASKDTFKQRRAAFTAKRLEQKGGPHDSEFFKCFMTYLDETLNQIIKPSSSTSLSSSPLPSPKESNTRSNRFSDDSSHTN